PLLADDPIFNCIPDEEARQRLVARFDWATTVPEHALGYRFDIVVSGREATPVDVASSLRATTSQTVGPFFALGLGWMTRSDLASARVPGERVTIAGRVLDGDGTPVPDALLEVWQADAQGSFAGEEGALGKSEAGFEGYGRIPSDESGAFRLTTIKPGAVRGPGGSSQAPHIAVSVFARGLMRRLVTRIYFPDDPANARDFALNRVEPSRRATLVARAAGRGTLEWNVVLQ